MFAQNEKISERQWKRLMTLELFGVTTLLLPAILCGTVRRDGVTALFLGMGLALLYGCLLNRAGKTMRENQRTGKNGGIFYEIFLFLMIVEMIVMGIWVLNLVAEMCRDILLVGSDIRFVLISFALVCAVGACKGMECRGRMAEVLYLFLLVPFLILLILAAGKVEVDRMPPLFTEPVGTIAAGSYEVFLVFQGLMLGFFAMKYVDRAEAFTRVLRYSIISNALFCFALMITAVGVFGLGGAASQRWMAVNLMTTPDFFGGIVERLDVLMVTIWIVSLFFFVSGCMLHGGVMTGRLLRLHRKWTGVLGVAVLVTAGSLLMGNKEYSYYVYVNYMKYIGVPLAVGILLLMVFFSGKRKPGTMAGLLCCCVLLGSLTGCGKRVELDMREFVLALGVDWTGDKVKYYYDGSDTIALETDHFYEFQSAYGQQADKYLDYNHLKVVIIGEKLASDREKMKEFLLYIENNELFARNTKLFFAKEDLEEIFRAGGELDENLGEYLENMYIDSNYYVEEQSASLGDFMSHEHEPDEAFLVPVLSVRSHKPAVEHYGLVREGVWSGTVDVEEANLIFLGNGVKTGWQLIVQEPYAVEMERVSRELAFSGEDAVEAQLTIHVRGNVVNNRVTDEAYKRELETLLEKKLETAYEATVEKWRTWDVLHLYQSLGSHDRRLWKVYQNRKGDFCREVHVRIQVDVTIL